MSSLALGAGMPRAVRGLLMELTIRIGGLDADALELLASEMFAEFHSD